MKILIITLIITLPLIVADFRVQDLNDARTAYETCRDEINPLENLFRLFAVSKFPEHKTSACYMKCMLEKLGLFDNTLGFLHKEIHFQLISKHPENKSILENSLVRCLTAMPDEAFTCQYVAKSFGCFMLSYHDTAIMSFI